MNELWHSNRAESIAEFHWRLTLIFLCGDHGVNGCAVRVKSTHVKGSIKYVAGDVAFIWCFSYYKAPCVPER